MKRIRYGEVSYSRIWDAGMRRIKDVPHAISWFSRSKESSENMKHLENCKDIKKGERCILIGNGPSLASMDFDRIFKEFTFGTNRIYLVSREKGLYPTYYLSVNDLVLKQFHADIEKLEMLKFVNWKHRGLFSDDNSIRFLRLSLRLNDYFSKDLTRGVCSGGTVTYVGLQLAYWMGFKEVVLVGVDHSFKTSGVPNTTEVREQVKDNDHFHPDYFPKGIKWQLPDLRRSVLAYKLARQVYENDGRRIIDSTVNGKCPVFEKVPFDDVFR